MATRSKGQRVDALVKVATLKVPTKVLWQKWGASPQDVKQWQAMNAATRRAAPSSPCRCRRRGPDQERLHDPGGARGGAAPTFKAWVWQAIGGLPGVTSFAFAAAQQDHTGWVYVHHIQVDARAKRKAAARDLAKQARQVIDGPSGHPVARWGAGVLPARQGAFLAARS